MDLYRDLAIQAALPPGRQIRHGREVLLLAEDRQPQNVSDREDWIKERGKDAGVAMKERPILFSGPMVRAILDGRKTQTRRMVKPQPLHGEFVVCKYHKTLVDKKGNTYPSDEDRFGICDVDGEWSVECPYGQVSDRLWVRETYRQTCDKKSWGCVQYRADESLRLMLCDENGEGDPIGTKMHREPLQKIEKKGPRWRPSIHMPRWASRITLEITGVRVEQIHDLSHDDAIAEGFQGQGWKVSDDRSQIVYPCHEFRQLWIKLNGEGSWASNPWVWVIEFKRINHGT